MAVDYKNYTNVANRDALKKVIWNDIVIIYSLYRYKQDYDDLYFYDELNNQIGPVLKGFSTLDDKSFGITDPEKATQADYLKVAQSDAEVLISYAVEQFEKNVKELPSSYPSSLEEKFMKVGTSGSDTGNENTGSGTNTNSGTTENSVDEELMKKLAVKYKELLNQYDFDSDSDDLEKQLREYAKTIESDQSKIDAAVKKILTMDSTDLDKLINSSSSNPPGFDSAKWAKLKIEIQKIAQDYVNKLIEKNESVDKKTFGATLEGKLKEGNNLWKQATDMGGEAKTYVTRTGEFA